MFPSAFLYFLLVASEKLITGVFVLSMSLSCPILVALHISITLFRSIISYQRKKIKITKSQL